MAKIELLERLFKEYRKWTIKLHSVSKNIEDNILQNDASSKLEEKVVSIAVSSLIVYIVTAIIGLFGISTGGVGLVLFFAAGWLISKGINKKVFGSERKLESITDGEKQMLKKLHDLIEKHNKIRKDLNDRTMVVFFTDYPSHKREFNEALNRLMTYDASNLALKYRYRHPYLVKKYRQEIAIFGEIYAYKKG